MNNNDKFQRYSRNIAIEKIGLSGQKKLANSKVLIAGAGGLGSAVITNLACLGVRNIGIIDFDKVEITNLNRQFIHNTDSIGLTKVESAKNWVKQFNPDIAVEIYNQKLNKTNYKELITPYDLVLDCFDSFESKFLLNNICIEMNKVLIHGGVEEFSGQVMTVIPKKTACLNCIFPEYSKEPVLNGIVSPIVNVIGSIQAAEVMKTVLELDELLTDTLLSYDIVNNRFKKINVKRSRNCPVCSD